jgi:hypothetical protein
MINITDLWELGTSCEDCKATVFYRDPLNKNLDRKPELLINLRKELIDLILWIKIGWYKITLENKDVELSELKLLDKCKWLGSCILEVQRAIVQTRNETDTFIQFEIDISEEDHRIIMKQYSCRWTIKLLFKNQKWEHFDSTWGWLKINKKWEWDKWESYCKWETDTSWITVEIEEPFE